MTTTVREALLLAVLAKFEAALATITGASAILTRNQALAERLDVITSVWVNLLDGSPEGEPVGLMGEPAVWEFTQLARAEIYVRGEDGPDRDALFDQVTMALTAALIADSTLGGACALAEVLAVEEPGADVLGEALEFKTGIAPVMLMYDAPTRAG